jgi:FkbH-like protein
VQAPTAAPDPLATLRSRRELIEGDIELPADLSLPRALALTARLGELEPPAAGLRLGLVHTYTSDLLDPWLKLHAAVQGLALDAYHAPYGLSPLEAEPGSGLARHDPDLTLFLLRREDLHPGLALPIVALSAEERETLMQETADSLAAMIGRFRAAVGGRLAISILPPLAPPGLGLYDSLSERSEGAWWDSLKRAIAARLRDGLAGTAFLDLDSMLDDLGRERFFDRRLWYSARYPFSTLAANELARRILAIGAADRLPRAKVLVLDADNTLWGGIVGEDGIEGIALGPDYPGNAFLDFQRRLLDFQGRGLLLALCSKNNPEDLDQVLKEHPHQLLRDGHFAARRVNWLPKSENLLALAEELNLGLDSFVFVDDSDHECALVRRELPQVTVVKTPAKPIRIPGCLDRLARLEVLSLTGEDLAKTRMYAEERQRRELKERVGGGDDSRAYLASLGMRMRIAIDPQPQLARLAQLTQKTNQFNLTTRRYTEEQMASFLASPDWLVASFSLADCFGDSGTVGLALIRRGEEAQAEIDTFLMSCRVIGRTAESAFLEALLGHLAREGVALVVADFLPSPKNRLVAGFLPAHRFALGKDGRYRRVLAESPPLAPGGSPIDVTLAPGSGPG